VRDPPKRLSADTSAVRAISQDAQPAGPTTTTHYAHSPCTHRNTRSHKANALRAGSRSAVGFTADRAQLSSTYIRKAASYLLK